MNTGARLMAACWTVVSLAGCSVAMRQEPPGPEGEPGSVTVGARVGGGASRAAPALDRSQVPVVGAPGALELPEIQDYTLANGVRVVLAQRATLPLVSLELQFRGGASAHPAAKAGLAALAADMLDEGTRTRSALDIADAVDILGATLSSTAGYDASQLRLSVLARRFPEALAILADVVMNPTFPEAELRRVREERLARVVQRSDVPAALADDAFARVLYGADHPYGAPLLGTTESLSALGRDDVVSFHRARYAPGQATLVVAGDVSRERLDSLLAGAFAGWEGRGEDPAPLPTPPAGGARTVHVVDKPGAAQTEIRLGRVAVARSTEGYYPLTVLNTVLGGSFTSRLNSRLREEKGYTYGAGSYFDMRRAPGPFEASAAVATAVTDSAVLDFVAEIEAMGDTLVPAAELARAKNYLALRLPQRFESLDDVVRRLAELTAYDVPLRFWEEYVPGVLAVDDRAVRAAARDVLDASGMTIVVAGDRASIEGPLRALGLGPVVAHDGRSEARE